MCLLGFCFCLSTKLVFFIVAIQLHTAWLLLLQKPVKSQNLCVANGLDVLRETKDIKRLRATFDLDSRKVYYKLKFCKKFSMCFATSIDHSPVNENVVNDIESWVKIIRVIQGKGRFMPYIKDSHSKEFGGPRDYYNCTGRFYIIAHKATTVDIQSVTKSLRSNRCLSNQLCTRTCLHKTEKRNRCHEVRIVCNFKCSKKSKRARKSLNPRILRVTETSDLDENIISD